MMPRSLAALGDVTSPSTWSGSPYHFLQAANAASFAMEPWRLDLAPFNWRRLAWNARHTLAGRGIGGYQYSRDFLDRAEKQIPSPLFATEVLTLNPHFPQAKSVRKAGGILNHYIDAPFLALTSGRGLDLRLPTRVVAEARELERANFVGSKRIVTMARWAAEVVTAECGISQKKVFTILPGANLDLPSDWNFPVPNGRAGKERDFVLGFVGKEWQRKGLPFIIGVRNELVRRGWKVFVHAAGNAPSGMQRQEGVHFAGFIDKWKDGTKFLDFLSACDVGCLFSSQEALGISTLEFLRAGIPVAGFAHEGMADTLPPDSGFRFSRDSRISEVANLFEAYLEDESMQTRLRENARRWSPRLTWERCVGEFEELWATGSVKQQVCPWLGLPEVHSAERVES